MRRALSKLITLTTVRCTIHQVSSNRLSACLSTPGFLMVTRCFSGSGTYRHGLQPEVCARNSGFFGRMERLCWHKCYLKGSGYHELEEEEHPGPFPRVSEAQTITDRQKEKTDKTEHCHEFLSVSWPHRDMLRLGNGINRSHTF
jgi:hypothetical protein